MLACTAAAACLALGAWSPAPAGAQATKLLPPKGKLFHGLSDTGDVSGYRRFRQQVGSKSAVLQTFVHWGAPIYRAIDRWEATKSRGAISISTERSYDGPELITPRAIRNGHGDEWLVYLNRAFSRRDQRVYVRLFAEMNGHWNAYSAFNPDGSHRGAAHKHKNFRMAWRRAAVILRGGGDIQRINRRLRSLGMPNLLRGRGPNDVVYRQNRVGKGVPRARVAIMWMPQTIGSPNVPGNRYERYWPGRAFVDWTGFDTYERFWRPWTFRRAVGLLRFQRGLPFAIGEYSPWNGDHSGRFTQRMMRFIRNRPRVRMAWYYQDFAVGGPHEVQHYEGARRVLRRNLARKTWMDVPPEWRGRKAPPPPAPPPAQGGGTSSG